MSAQSINRNKILNNTRRMSGVTKSALVRSDKKEDDESRVNVAVRCRPLSEKEISDGHESIVEFESRSRIVVHDTSKAPSEQLGTNSGERSNISHVYDFDTVFDYNCTQKEVYDSVCRPIVDSVLEGFNGTIFAYGQTGTGKTYTLEGISGRRRQQQQQRQTNKNQTRRSSSGKRKNLDEPNENENEDSNKGIIPRAFEQIFSHVARTSQVQFLIRASYLEIYQEEIHDLLRKDRSIKLELHDRPDVGVYVKDLTSFVCKSITEIERVMRVGNQNRMVAATDMNEHSSRSHAIFMITVEQQQLISNGIEENQSATSGNEEVANGSKSAMNQADRVIRVGKLNLVDLAGSERQRKTNSFGQRQRESIKINLSLSALGNVITSLTKINNNQQPKTLSNNLNSNAYPFIPYRDSKLTQLLRDSLGGNARTLMIANIGPASYNYDETINTLNYASRAKCIKNKPRINEDPKDALLRELQIEIDDLRRKLANMGINQNYGSKANTKMVEKKTSSNAENNSEIQSKNKNIELELIELKQKLSLLEDKLLNNNRTGSTILDYSLLKGYTQEQELELEKSRQELASQADREKSIRDELDRREEAELMAKESFSSIQQEVEVKKRLIKQILIKIKTIREETETTQRSYRIELDELEQLHYVLQRELKLKCLIMDNFIPNIHVDQLLARIVYNDKRNCCSIAPLDLPLDYCNLNDDSVKYEDYWRPTSNNIRARSEFEQIGETIYPSNIRYKYENLIEPQLEFLNKSERTRELDLLATSNVDTKRDVAGSLESSEIQSMIDQALNLREPDIVI